MDDFQTKFEQLRVLVEQHVPPEVLASAVPVAVLFLIGGIAVSVLGAKFSRVGFTAIFGILGAVAGYRFGAVAGVPAPVCALLGAGMIGTIGHMTFQLWVGAVVAVVFSSIALGAFGYQKLLPHVSAFEDARMVAVAPAGGGSFTLPTPAQQEANLTQSLTKLADEFWAFVTGKDADMERRAQAVATSALVTGLFVGVLAVRWALILATSVLGTVLVSSGAATLLTSFLPGSYEALVGHPAIAGSAMGAFFVTSFLLQAMLTRQAPKDEKPESGKS